MRNQQDIDAAIRAISTDDIDSAIRSVSVSDIDNAIADISGPSVSSRTLPRQSGGAATPPVEMLPAHDPKESARRARLSSGEVFQSQTRPARAIAQNISLEEPFKKLAIDPNDPLAPLSMLGPEVDVGFDFLRMLNRSTGFTRRAAALANRLKGTPSVVERPVRGLLPEARIPIRSFTEDAPKFSAEPADPAAVARSLEAQGNNQVRNALDTEFTPQRSPKYKVKFEPEERKRIDAAIRAEIETRSAAANAQKQLPARAGAPGIQLPPPDAPQTVLTDAAKTVQRGKGGRMTKVFQGTDAPGVDKAPALEAAGEAQLRNVVNAEVESTGTGKFLRQQAAGTLPRGTQPRGPRFTDPQRRALLDLYFPQEQKLLPAKSMTPLGPPRTDAPITSAAKMVDPGSPVPRMISTDVGPEDAARYLVQLDDYISGKSVTSGTKFKDVPFAIQQELNRERDRLDAMLPRDFVNQITKQPPKPAANPFPAPKTATASGSITSAVGRFRSLDNVLARNGGEGVVKPIRLAAREGNRFLAQYHDVVHTILGQVKRGSPDAVAAARILDGEIVPGASEKAVSLAKTIRQQFFDPIYAQTQNPAIERVAGPITYVKSYLPRIRDREMELLGIDQQTADAMLRDLYPREFVPRFFKRRKDANLPYSLDLFEILPKYLAAAKREIYDIPAYVQAKSALGTMPKDEFGELAKWYADNYIGQPTARGVPNEAYSAFSRFMGDRMYDALIGGNPMSAAINLTQTVVNTYPEIGAIHTVSGLAKFATPAGRAKFTESGLLFDFPELERLSEGVNVGTHLRDALHFMFRKAEMLNRGIAYLGGLSKAQAQGLAGEAAEQFALDVVERTQFTYGRSSPIYMQERLSEAVPGAQQFMTFPLKEGEFLWTTLADGVKKGATPDDRARAGRLLVVLGGLGAVGHNFIRDVLPRISPSVQLSMRIVRYIGQVTNGDIPVENIPTDAINGILEYAPGALGFKKVFGNEGEAAVPATPVRPAGR